MRLDVVAKESHFVDHLAPVWMALPPKVRGRFYFRGHGDCRPVEGMIRGQPPASSNPTLVAAAGDLIFARRLGRRVAIMEHGAGQSYGGILVSAGGKRLRGPWREHSSYAGGANRDAELFLHPGPHPAARDAARYPDARVEVVGCPKLDQLPRKAAPSKVPVVAVSFHWNCHIAPETRWALPDFERHVRSLAADRRYQVIGHAHPRAAVKLSAWYERCGIEFVPTFGEVCERADVYVIDNSSTLFEFAATGRPVVLMNARLYRRPVEHGLRFWQAATVGVQANVRDGLIGAVTEALRDTPDQQDARERALDLVYGYRSGAAARAAGVLREWAS